MALEYLEIGYLEGNTFNFQIDRSYGQSLKIDFEYLTQNFIIVLTFISCIILSTL